MFRRGQIRARHREELQHRQRRRDSIEPAGEPELSIQRPVAVTRLPGDLVVDIFAGSNTTGWVAEAEKRRWLAFDESREYVAASAFRFLRNGVDAETMRTLHDDIMHGRLAHHEV